MHNSGASRREGAQSYPDIIGDITPGVIDWDRRSRNDRGNDRAGAFVPRRQRTDIRITAMDRRHMLKSAASTAFGAGLLAAAASEATNAQPTPSREKLRRADYVECADGTKLAFTDWGAGKPVVFIHAWALPSAMWDYQRAPLSEQGLRCIAYDRRGHGRSSVPNGGYDCDSLADDLSTLLTELDLRQVTLVLSASLRSFAI